MKPRRGSYAARVAREAKAHFGLLERSEANRLVLHKWCRDRMVEHGVRPSHMAALLPLAVQLAFVPLQEEIEAAQLSATLVVHKREEMMKGWCGFWGSVQKPFARK